MSIAHGVNAHLAPDEYLRTLAGAGIRSFRIDVSWADIDRTGGAWWAEIDRNISTIEALDGRVLANVAYIPPSQSQDGQPTGNPKDLGAWAAFVEQVVTRYPTLDALSIGNEPNLRQFWTGTRSQYLKFLLAGLDAAAKVRPALKFVGPDLSSSPTGDPYDWLSDILDAAGFRLDVISHHQYDGHDSPEGRIAEIDKLNAFLLRRGEARAVWITETGLNVPDPSAMLSRIMAAMRARAWWQRTFWYDSHGEGWGLLDTQTGAPRPALETYRAIIAR